MKWYVLRAISGKEAQVKEYIDAEIKNNHFNGYVSQVLIPTEKVFQVRNGKRIVKERTYLPGYVLVEAALVGEIAHELRNTPNVIGFLGGSENPTPLRQAEVNRILGTVDELMEENQDILIPYSVGASEEESGQMISFLFVYSTSAYVRPSRVVERVSASAGVNEEGKLEIRIENTGSVHQMLNSLSVTVTGDNGASYALSEEEMGTINGQNLLAGSTLRIVIDIPEALSGASSYTAEVGYDYSYSA